jgi:nitrate/nitrite transport system substrate-binding protein
MVLNNNGQAITLKKDLTGAGYADLAAAKGVIEAAPRTMAMTFPGGTHDTWLRYWLKATGANLTNVNVIPIPPPQMVANMKVGTMDAYCVGEPWNAVAVAQDVGYTAITTQDIWTHHPEKALVVTNKFRTEQEQNLKDTMAAVLKAQRWLDDLVNRTEAANLIAPPGYVNAPAVEIQGRLLGQYAFGGGLPDKDFGGEQMMFFRDGQTPSARKSYVYWWLAQYQRFGLLTGTPDYEGIANEILLQDLYRSVAAAEGVAVPDDDMSPFLVKLDNVTFDPARVAEEVARA